MKNRGGNSRKEQDHSPTKNQNTRSDENHSELEEQALKLFESNFNLKINYKVDNIFDFNTYKMHLSDLFSEFFEDIITTEDKIKFVEFALAHQLSDSGRYNFYIEDLKKKCDNK